MRAVADGTREAVRHLATILEDIPLIIARIFLAKKDVSDRTAIKGRGEERRGEEEKEQLTKQRSRKKECKTCFALWKSERRREYQTLRIRNSGSSSCWPHQKRKCFTYPSRVCRHSLSTLVAGTRLEDGSIG